jgi:hypothetical protein
MAWGIAITGITLLGMVVLLLAEVFTVVADDAGAKAEAAPEQTRAKRVELDKAA